MSETFLGRYAAIQKRTAVAAILTFTNEECESLKALREADRVGMSEGASADTNDNYTRALGTGNETIGGTIDEGAV